MPLTLQDAKNLQWLDQLYHMHQRNADGSPQRWRVNGKVKVWKTRPDEVRVPIKHGLRDFDYLTHNDLHLLTLDEDEAIGWAALFPLGYADDETAPLALIERCKDGQRTVVSFYDSGKDYQDNRDSGEVREFDKWEDARQAAEEWLGRED